MGLQFLDMIMAAFQMFLLSAFCFSLCITLVIAIPESVPAAITAPASKPRSLQSIKNEFEESRARYYHEHAVVVRQLKPGTGVCHGTSGICSLSVKEWCSGSGTEWFKCQCTEGHVAMDIA